jgi:hypothetical protein
MVDPGLPFLGVLSNDVGRVWAYNGRSKASYKQ